MNEEQRKELEKINTPRKFQVGTLAAAERHMDTAAIDFIKERMMKRYQYAVEFLKDGKREYAQYQQGMGDAYKAILEDMYDYNPEQEIDELDDLLVILDDL